MRVKLHIQYDGGAYKGWQAQAGKSTICGELCKAFKKLKIANDSGPVKIAAAGRTDAGVHAWGQVVHVDVDKPMKPIKFMGGLNRFLPKDIRVVRAAEVGEDFQARFGAFARHYKYLLWDGRVLRPDLIGRVGHSIYPVDVEKMAQALEILGFGEMDFSGLRDAECQAKSPVCKLYYARIVRQDSGIIELSVGANRFLQHMVRNLMGTLIEIGTGKREPEDLKRVISLKKRSKAGTTFEAAGLYLVGVEYPEHTEKHVVGAFPAY